MRILIVRIGALGDTLMTTPLLRALKQTFPPVEIDFLCSGLAAPLLELHPALHNTLRLQYPHLPALLSLEKWRRVRAIKRRRYQRVILLESAPDFRQLLARAGRTEIQSFRETPFDPGLHSTANYLRTGGFEQWRDWSLDLDLYLSPEDQLIAEELLVSQPSPRVALHAGYGPKGRKRHQNQRLRGWSAPNFIDVGRRLTEMGYGVILTGSTEDRSLAGQIAAGLDPGTCLNLAGQTTVRQLAAVIRRSQLMVSVDSGPAHMAAAVGTPLVVLWGPGILEQTRPISSRTPIRIVRYKVPCAPCYGTSMMKTCQRNVCMEFISPDLVMEAVSDLQRTGAVTTPQTDERGVGVAQGAPH